jgi:uncharacterized membrane protein
MISKWRFQIQNLLKQVWVQATLYSLLGVSAAFAARLFGFLVPDKLAEVLGGDAVDKLLSIMATSMLAVTTFSLSVMVLAYNQAASGATPRAIRLLVEDRTAQTALSSFIGAFLFSMVGLVALSSGFYSSHERVILFAVTILVVISVVATLIRWISELNEFGRLPNTIERLEAAAVTALELRAESPRFGGRPYSEMPAGGISVEALDVGYVQHIDLGALQACAEAADAHIRLEIEPGSFLYRGRPAFTVRREGTIDDEWAHNLREVLTIGKDRTYDQDARFGLIALSEVASRALSPGVNDPGTAISIIGVLVRALTRWCSKEEDPNLEHDRLYIGELCPEDLLHDSFTPIARDGAGMVEVMIRLQKGLQAVAELGNPELAEAARRRSDTALERARVALSSSEDVARVEDAARWTSVSPLTRDERAAWMPRTQPKTSSR